MAANQRRTPIQIGFAPSSPNGGVSGLALSAASTYLALGFTLDQAKALSKVQVYCSAVQNAVSIGANDLTCDIYSDSGGTPNASLQSVNTLTSTIASGWVEFTGFTYSLSAATQYWLVFKNNNGTPGTNYPTYQWGGSNTISGVANGSSPHWGWLKCQYNGTSWTSSAAAVCGYRLQFSDGTYDGFPVQSISGASDKAYGSTPGSGNEVGVQFTVPSGAKWNVRGLTFYVNIAGSPTGSLLYRLYQNGTLVATTPGIPVGNAAISGATYNPAYFASTVTLNPGDTVTCTIADSATDSSSNAYIMGDEYKFASDSNTRALMPFDGTLQKAVTSSGGGASTPSFTLTPTSIFPFVLLLDSADEFGSSGGGGVPRIGPALIGGICG